MKIENIRLEMQLNNDAMWFCCTVDNVLTAVTIITTDLTIVQRLSITK